MGGGDNFNGVSDAFSVNPAFIRGVFRGNRLSQQRPTVSLCSAVLDAPLLSANA